MEFLVEYWYIIIAFMCVGGIFGVYVYKVFQMPTDEQMQKVREWCLYAVLSAEREFKSGTGKLKLRYTYDMFLSKFSWLATVISFETFSELIDSALLEMRSMLSNPAIQEYVGGSENAEAQRLTEQN